VAGQVELFLRADETGEAEFMRRKLCVNSRLSCSLRCLPVFLPLFLQQWFSISLLPMANKVKSAKSKPVDTTPVKN